MMREEAMASQGRPIVCMLLIAALLVAFCGMGRTAVTGESVPTRAAPGDVELFWISMNKTNHAATPILDAMAPASGNGDVVIALAANASAGWPNACVEVRGWYDGGKTGGASLYPSEGDGSRNSAFRIVYCPANETAWVAFPAGDLEVTLKGSADDVGQANAQDPAQSIHVVELTMELGPQLWAADGDGFAAADDLFDDDPAQALKDAHSWDLEVAVSEAADPSVESSLFGEFGIEHFRSITVMGNPSATGEPGDTVRMAPFTTIEYTPNTFYWVNVTIQDLKLDGVGPEFIPAANVSVRNTHPMADAANSGIAGEPVAFAGEHIPLCVWGLGGDAMAPAGNGTCTAGPWTTDFNSANWTTQLEWWISIPKGTELGLYQAIIVVEIEPGGEEPVIVRLKQITGIQVVDLTPPVSEVLEANERNVTAEAHDGESEVENVTLFYRYSEDGETWEDWTAFGTDMQEPWSWDFTSPEGNGRYEFYTIAVDSGDNAEAAPASADASFETGSGIPGFGLPTVMAALCAALAVMSVRRLRKG